MELEIGNLSSDLEPCLHFLLKYPWQALTWFRLKNLLNQCNNFEVLQAFFPISPIFFISMWMDARLVQNAIHHRH